MNHQNLHLQMLMYDLIVTILLYSFLTYLIKDSVSA